LSDWNSRFAINSKRRSISNNNPSSFRVGGFMAIIESVAAIGSIIAIVGMTIFMVRELFR
jgi:hypothetical protein